MAEGKMFTGVKNVGKKVPKWAWYVSGGILIAGGIYYFRSRGEGEAPVSGDESYTDQGVVGYTDPDNATGLIVPPVIGSDAVSGELNTDIPTETLGIFGGLFDTLGGIIASQGETQSEILQMLANGGTSSDQQGAAAGGVVTVQPKTPTKPKPNPASRLDPGYRAGATVDMGKNARKHFPGAIGWVRIGSGETGTKHWIDVHVRFCNKLERWRVRPNAKGSPWTKTFSGPRPDICK